MSFPHTKPIHVSITKSVLLSASRRSAFEERHSKIETGVEQVVQMFVVWEWTLSNNCWLSVILILLVKVTCCYIIFKKCSAALTYISFLFDPKIYITIQFVFFLMINNTIFPVVSYVTASWTEDANKCR